MLKIKDNINLKILKNYGFTEYNYEYARHYKSGIKTSIDKRTREIKDIDTDYGFKTMLDLGESTRINDLIIIDLVEEIEE